MTKLTPTRRSYSRRLRQIYVTTSRRERVPETFARILTSTALGKARLEAEARADHQARFALASAHEHPRWEPESEGTSDV